MKILIAAIITTLITVSGYGQVVAGTNLKVQLQSIQSIRINEAQSDVAISLATASEYMNGKSSNQADHIEIMSNSNYEIKVSAATNLIGDTASIDINTVTITPSLGSVGGATDGNIQLNPVALSLNDNTIVQSFQGDAQRSFNIKYQLSGGDEYLDKPAGTYSTLVTYTILAP
jgi:hypothetical protein